MKQRTTAFTMMRTRPLILRSHNPHVPYIHWRALLGTKRAQLRLIEEPDLLADIPYTLPIRQPQVITFHAPSIMRIGTIKKHIHLHPINRIFLSPFGSLLTKKLRYYVDSPPHIFVDLSSPNTASADCLANYHRSLAEQEELRNGQGIGYAINQLVGKLVERICDCARKFSLLGLLATDSMSEHKAASGVLVHGRAGRP
jgi:hypothetical protein